MNTEKLIYLTFDDGPTPEVTPWVLTLLDKYQFKATFFCLGINAQQHSNIIEQIIKRGHAIGNHGYEHLNGWKTKNKVYIANADKGASILNTKLFRPPYGKITPLQWFTLRKQYKIVFWDYLSKDYLNIEKQNHFLSRLQKHTHPNRIIVFHDSNKAFPTLQKYLEPYFEWLKNENYIPQLLHTRL